MAYNEDAIRKGMAAEYLAKAYFSKAGYAIYLPDSNENSVDFIAGKGKDYTRVQVKAHVTFGDLIRIRNKHGQNRAYGVDDYDVLAGVWVDRNRIFLFRSADINGRGQGESLTVATESGRPLSNHKRIAPYYEGIV